MSTDGDLRDAILELARHLVLELVGEMDLPASRAFSVLLGAGTILFYTAPPQGRQRAIEAVRKWLAEFEANVDETELRVSLRRRLGVVEADLDA